MLGSGAPYKFNSLVSTVPSQIMQPIYGTIVCKHIMHEHVQCTSISNTENICKGSPVKIKA